MESKIVKARAADQNATVHEFDFDKLGRQTQDRVTQVGLGIDDAVRRIALSYDVRGLVYTVTSYDNPVVGSGSAINQVLQRYRDFMQLGEMYQEHSGVVGGSTLRSLYDYVNGTGNTARLYRYSYPDETNLFTFIFGSADSVPDRLSRPDYTTASHYTYLGLGSFAEAYSLQYPHRLQSTLATGSGANPYASLDRFGRIINNQWIAYDDGGTMLDQVQYGYDRVGNRLWRYNVVAHTNSAAFDEQYGYDGLNQLTDMQRGSYSTAPVLPSTPPSGFSGTPSFQQTWALDSTGNWTGFTEASSGSTTLDQSRTANRVNEITDIANSTGGDWTQPVYDAAGNMTTMPQPGDPTAENGYTATYDAWNRLVRLMDGEDIVQENEYDGTTRRIIKKTYTSGTLSETRHYYYNNNWQVLAEYTGTTPVYSTPERIYFWGLRYIDELVSRYRSVSGSLDEYLRPLQDANWNVTAICDGTAAVVERYAYTAYGTPTFQDDTFTPLSPGESAYNWETLYAGYRFDAATGLFFVRWRILHALLGMWNRRDPAHSSVNLYNYVMSKVLNRLDPTGLIARKCCIDKLNLEGDLAVALDLLGTYALGKAPQNQTPGVRSPFEFTVRFKNAGDCCCDCCEVRQYIKGEFKKDGKVVRHELGASKDISKETFEEDGAFSSILNTLERFGHRADSAWANDHYYAKDGATEDRAKGCYHKHRDFPGWSPGAAGELQEYDLTFRIDVVDVCAFEKPPLKLFGLSMLIWRKEFTVKGSFKVPAEGFPAMTSQLIPAAESPPQVLP